MARARNIKPSFFSNEDLAELPFEARLLFIGLWTLADREGRLEDRPKRIKMALFPADNIDAEQFLNSLQTVGLLKRYVCDGFSVIQITNFVKHQVPHGLEKDSELPDEDGFYCHHQRNQSGLVSGKNKPEFYTKQQLTEKNNSFQTVKEPFKSSYFPCHNRLNPDSLNPDSLNPDSNTEEEKKVEKKESPQAAIAASPPHHFSELPIAKAKPKRSQAIDRPEGVADAVWQDWLALRSSKKAAVTQTVLAQARVEADKAGMSLNDFLTEWCLRGSQGLKAEWLQNDRARKTGSATGAAPTKQFTVNGVGVSPVTVGNVRSVQEFFRRRGQEFHAEIGERDVLQDAAKSSTVIDI